MTNLKKIREKNNLSQAELARKSGISKRVIQHYEQQERDINNAAAKKVFILSKVLNCSMQDLLELDKIKDELQKNETNVEK